MISGVIQGKFALGRPALPAAAPPLATRPPCPGPPGPGGAVQPTPAAGARGAGAVVPVDPAALRLPAGGRPLPEALRRNMERVFAADLGEVRIHEGREAQRLGAAAFTTGPHIYFAPGHFVPDTARGRQLLGHEIAHVLQQRAGRVRNPLGSGLVVVQEQALEAEAERMGLRAAQAIPARPAAARVAVPVAQPMKRKKTYGDNDFVVYDQPSKKKKTVRKSTKPTPQQGGSGGSHMMMVPYGGGPYLGQTGFFMPPQYPQGIPFGGYGGGPPSFGSFSVGPNPFVYSNLLGPIFQHDLQDQSRKKGKKPVLIPQDELEETQQEALTGLYIPPPIPPAPPYFTPPAWGGSNSVTGGSFVTATLGPAAGDPLNKGSIPKQGECTSVEDLNANQVLGRAWIKGHLLNDGLGGPGVSKNLTPMTHQANMIFKGFESVLKNAVEWCRLRSSMHGDTDFFGVDVAIRVVGTKWPNSFGPERHLADYLDCRMKYVKRDRNGTGFVSDLGPQDPQPVWPYPSPTGLLAASKPYSCWT